MYSPDDYDNTASAGDDDHEQLLIGTTTSTKTRTTIKLSSSDEQSLDQLVAHLLGEVSPPPPNSGQQQQQQSGGPGSSPWTALRWPQGDSLPRVEMRRGLHHDVVGKHLPDENDNIIKNDVDVVTSPPLLTVRKKATSTSSTLEEVVSELSMAASGFQVLGKEERQRCHDDTVSSTHGGAGAPEMTSPSAQQVPASQTERLQSIASVRAENETSLDGASDRDSCSVMSFDGQKTSLMDQFKALRLEVLTSTSQLLSCVSGTWKRGESFRSKLTTIMQLCLALRTSVGRLETFLQCALTPSTATANSPLVETANTRVKNLQAVQTSIDAYIETLDVENLSGGGGGGMASTQDLKVGGIIHLTKEIPGLVRTFAPVIEHLAATSDVTTSPPPGTAAGPHQLDTTSSDTSSQLQHSVVDTMPLDSETQQQKHQAETLITHQDNRDEQNLHVEQHIAVAEPAGIQSVQTPNEQRSDTDAQQLHGSVTSNKSASVLHAQLTSTEQTKISAGRVQDDTTPTTSGTDLPPVFAPTASGERVIADDVSELTSQQPVLLPVVLSSQVESAKPPTPPPKLRVASQYHASLGISNSLTAAATTTATTTTTTTTTTRRYDDDDDDVVSTKSEGRREVVIKDKFQQSDKPRLGGGASDVLTMMNYVTGCSDDVVAADAGYFKFPRAGVDAEPPLEPVVLRRHHPDPDPDSQQLHYRVSESELETPDFRASGVSQTMVDQLEALQRQAAAQAVVMHTDTTAGYDRFDTTTATSPPNPHQQQSTLTGEDRRLLMFYCDQMTGHWKVLDNAASAFFHCIDRRQPPKVFVSHSKFVIVAGRKIAYVGDVLARNIDDDNARDWIVAHSNRLCNGLKMAARSTKEAALAYPAVPEQQLMVDCIKEVTDWAIELKEVVDRLAYIGRPDHVLV